MRGVGLVWMLLALLVALGSCGAPEPADAWVTREAELMHTRVAVILPAAQASSAELVFDAFRAVEELANEWRPGSPLARVNAEAGGAPVPVPAELLALVERSIALGEQTEGAFDLTWAAVWDLWDFRAPAPRAPTAEQLAARLPLIDYRRVELDREAGTLRLPEAGMKIGLGGVAKGWALDRAAAALRAAGVRDFDLVAGGQVYAAGSRGERPWRVGVRDPRGGPEDWFALIEPRDASVSTSGDYERWFERDGVRYHHLLDPRTGWPARGVRSATVIAQDGTTADALSTALVVLGVRRGLALIAGMEGVEALLVDEAGQVHRTPGCPARVLRPPTP